MDPSKYIRMYEFKMRKTHWSPLMFARSPNILKTGKEKKRKNIYFSLAVETV